MEEARIAGGIMEIVCLWSDGLSIVSSKRYEEVRWRRGTSLFKDWCSIS